MIRLICLVIIAFPTLAQLRTKSQIHSRKFTFLKSTSARWASIFDEQITGSIRFVGLGEFPHGGNETIQFKTKMIQYLVEQKGYRELLLEYPNILISPLAEYLVNSKSINIDSVVYLAKSTFGRTFLGNASFYDLLIWIKEYNLSHLGDEINLRGIDIEGASEAFPEYFVTSIMSLMDASDASKLRSEWKSIPKDSVVAVQTQWFRKNQELIKMRAEKGFFDKLNYDVKCAEYKLTHEAFQRTNVYRASAFRDSVMAANVVVKDNAKAIIWAHNLHVTTSDNVVSMGNYLKKIAGKQYYTILTDFSNQSTVWSISNTGDLFKKTYASNIKTVANRMLKKDNVDQEIIFFEDIKNKHPKVNCIERTGNQYIFGKGRPFDCLVVLRDVTPFIFQ